MEKNNLLKTIKIEKDSAIVSINPNIYPLHIIKSAAFLMIDDAFVVLDGNPAEEIRVELMAKKGSIQEVVERFHDELLNQAVYELNASRNKGLVDSLVELSYFLNSGDAIEDTVEMAMMRHRANHPTDKEIEDFKADKSSAKELYIKGVQDPLK